MARKTAFPSRKILPRKLQHGCPLASIPGSLSYSSSSRHRLTWTGHLKISRWVPSDPGGPARLYHRGGNKRRHVFRHTWKGLRGANYLQLASGNILARILVSYIFISPITTTKSSPLRISDRSLGYREDAASALFMVTRLLASVHAVSRHRTSARLRISDAFAPDQLKRSGSCRRLPCHRVLTSIYQRSVISSIWPISSRLHHDLIALFLSNSFHVDSRVFRNLRSYRWLSSLGFLTTVSIRRDRLVQSRHVRDRLPIFPYSWRHLHHHGYARTDQTCSTYADRPDIAAGRSLHSHPLRLSLSRLSSPFLIMECSFVFIIR